MKRLESEDGAGDLRPVSPGAKALGAMELASRRARESTVRASSTDDPDPAHRHERASAWTDPRGVDARHPMAFESAPRRREHATGPPERWLAVAVAVAVLLVVVAAIALAVSLSTGSGNGPVATPPAVHRTTHAGGTAARSAAGSASQPSSAPAVPQTTSTLPSLGTPGGAPVISSLSPPSGTGGQAVEITGSNFLSSDGQIVATVAGQVSPTDCPSQTTCTVTVPPGPARPGPVPVTITTSAGTSNTVTFTYE